MKILIIRFSSIGDIVLTSPVIRCLKKQLPVGTEVHFLTKPSYAMLLDQNPYIDKLLLLKPRLSDTIAEIKKEKYDRIIDLHNNLRTLALKLRTMIPSFSFDKLNFPKYLITRFKISALPNIHIVDRYFKTVKPLGVINDGEGLDYFNPVPWSGLSAYFENPGNQDFITMAIGGQHGTKKMPVDKLLEIISGSNLKIVVLGGKEDIEVAGILQAGYPDKVINLAGKLSLHQSAGFVAESRGLITHDTGMMHIAAALKKPVLAIWGNTIPEFGMFPYYGKHDIFYKNFEIILGCRPCSKLGYEKCPLGHFKCMNLQDTGQITETMNRF